jgi:hypothetical protein
MIELDPQKRISASAALQHPYFSSSTNNNNNIFAGMCVFFAFFFLLKLMALVAIAATAPSTAVPQRVKDDTIDPGHFVSGISSLLPPLLF